MVLDALDVVGVMDVYVIVDVSGDRWLPGPECRAVHDRSGPRPHAAVGGSPCARVPCRPPACLAFANRHSMTGPPCARMLRSAACLAPSCRGS